MLKDLIVIEDEEKYQVDTLEELVELLIDKQYYEMSQEEKMKKLELKAFANCMLTDKEVVKKYEGDLEGKFIIQDEITYIYSLLLLNKVTLLESTKSNYLTGALDKTNISDNYVIVNHFAKELLENYLGGSDYDVCL